MRREAKAERETEGGEEAGLATAPMPTATGALALAFAGAALLVMHADALGPRPSLWTSSRKTASSTARL